MDARLAQAARWTTDLSVNIAGIIPARYGSSRFPGKLLKLLAGKPVIEATLEAVRMRLRPILMTSLAFGFGVLPLALASGAGAGSQNAIGTGVLGGVITATALGIFFVPLFFVVIKRVFSRQPQAPASEVQPQEGN